MSASDHLNDEQFYETLRNKRPLFHGSMAEMEPGTLITPLKPRKVAYATPHLHTARVFSKRGGEAGHVYEVEPVDSDRTWAGKMRHTGNESHYEVMAEEGFRVVSKVPKSRRSTYYRGKSQ